MNIVEPYARIMAPASHNIAHVFSKYDGVELLKRIEWCGRISHRSEDKQTEDSTEKFIRAVVIGHGDWSIVEHASVSVDMLVDRGITHEVVRHRLFSFTQESTRFVNYEKKMPPSFILPPGLLEEPLSGEEESEVEIWRRTVNTCEEGYKKLLKRGAPQIARSVFPNALASRIVVTGNLRNWRLFLLMRTTRESHPQMRQVTIPLLKEFQEKIPILFEDIIPEDRQSESIKKGR